MKYNVTPSAHTSHLSPTFPSGASNTSKFSFAS
jgi:hypothetical protein